MADDTSVQNDEIEALAAIFGDDWVTENEQARVYSITIRDESNSDKSILLEVKLPANYPSKDAPNFTISAPWMSRKMKSCLMIDLDQIFVQNLGNSIIYMWIEKCREYLSNEVQIKSTSNLETQNPNLEDQESKSETNLELEQVEIISGEPLVDRKSVFQAHVAKVTSMYQVNHVLDTLKSNKKIATATHNISAYRISKDESSSNCVLQDCDDDGETHAGSRLLHLLQILDVSNVLVIVSRWFGGIQLGPDRFKHINNVARDLLDKSGFILNKKK